MKYNYIHYKYDKTNLINTYFLALFPLLLFGLYKNGILLYKHNLLNFFYAMTPLYFYIIGAVVGFFIALLYNESIKENILICLIISASISLNTNLILYPILLFIVLFIGKYLCYHYKLKININAFTRLFLILGLFIGTYSYLNISEKLNIFNYNKFDIFLGFSNGGIAITSSFLVICSLIILSLNKYYKKTISFTSSLIFIIITFLYVVLTKNYNYFNLMLNGTTYYSFVFIASDLYCTPYDKKGMIIYGFIIGILTSVISIIFNFYEASYISILLASIFIPFINKIINYRHFKNLE